MVRLALRVALLLLILILLFHKVYGQKPQLKFHHHTFKIVQITDTHIRPNNSASLGAVENINSALDAEKPDLVVYTGDIVTARPVCKGWQMILQPCIDRKIPYAVVLGNHDDEHGVSRSELAEWIANMPFSLMVPKTEGVTGNGNYALRIMSSDSTATSALLYCMDSNSYSTMERIGGYGWFNNDQIEWYRKESRELKKETGYLCPALAFFHIPLPEYKLAYCNMDSPSVGIRKESESSPMINTGMFRTMVEAGDVMATFVGHDHNNDYIAYMDGIALGYGRFSGGRTTYGALDCGVRVIYLKEGRRSFNTWIRTGAGEILNPVNYPSDFQDDKKIVSLPHLEAGSEYQTLLVK